MEKGGEDSVDNEYHIEMAKAKRSPKGRSSRKRSSRRLKRIFAVLVLIIFIAGAILWALPLPALSSTTTLKPAGDTALSLPWPSYGEEAIGAQGYGVLDTHGTQTMVPTASVAKIITALTVLKKYPLSVGQQGPIITLGPMDVASYNNYLNEDGSVIKVVSGEQITEYQAIEAMLLPSANNMADSLANWAYGTLPDYVTAANQEVQSLGLTHTTIADDASGFQPNTRSTAHDLVELGEEALSNPVISEIVAEKQANLPVAGVVSNVNRLIGEDGIVGIKTGNTSQAGGVYLFAATHQVNSSTTVTVIGAIMGAPTLDQAFSDSIPLLNAAANDFVIDNVIYSGEVVGYYSTPWNNVRIDAAATRNVAVPIWKGASLVPQVSLSAIYAPKASGSVVGSINLSVNSSTYSSPVTLSQSISGAPWHWRLFGRTHLHDL